MSLPLLELCDLVPYFECHLYFTSVASPSKEITPSSFVTGFSADLAIITHVTSLEDG